MISIVVSSYKPHLFRQLTDNISKTIGLRHEIIQIPNDNQYGICQAYNLGAARAKYNCLIFMHEDVIFHSYNWGIKIITKFSENPRLGLVGFAGASVKAESKSSWLLNTDRHYVFNYIQSGRKGRVDRRNISADQNVEVLDGFFLATTKAIYKQFLFDDVLLSGYHGYDLDISLAVGQKYELKVIDGIDIEHSSEGRFDFSWFRDVIAVHTKWKRSLPRYSAETTEHEKKEIEYYAVRQMMSVLNDAGYSPNILIKMGVTDLFPKLSLHRKIMLILAYIAFNVLHIKRRIT